MTIVFLLTELTHLHGIQKKGLLRKLRYIDVEDDLRSDLTVL